MFLSQVYNVRIKQPVKRNKLARNSRLWLIVLQLDPTQSALSRRETYWTWHERGEMRVKRLQLKGEMRVERLQLNITAVKQETESKYHDASIKYRLTHTRLKHPVAARSRKRHQYRQQRATASCGQHWQPQQQKKTAEAEASQ